MTCHDAQAHLDDLIDNELPPHTAAQVRDHIDNCHTCRREYERAKQLLELMRTASHHEPGNDYWQDTIELILARTVDSSPDVHFNKTEDRYAEFQKNALMRSIVSAAASLVILFLALLIGSQQSEQLSRKEIETGPVLATSGIRDIIGPAHASVFTSGEEAQLARGLALVGTPGILGRFTGLPELILGID